MEKKIPFLSDQVPERDPHRWHGTLCKHRDGQQFLADSLTLEEFLEKMGQKEVPSGDLYNIAVENHHRNSESYEFYHSKWWFSIVM